jgi:GH24 family phage-related lysozyme (muramidase)
MPHIKARELAGLSPEPRAAAADSYVEAGSHLAIEWIRLGPGNQLSLIKLAGPYTGPMESKPLPSGSERYINPNRFEIPPDAWLDMGTPAAAPTPTPPSSAQTVMASTRSKLPPEVAAINHHYESCCLTAYPDPGPTGLPITIGWGSTFYQDGSPIRLGDVINQSQADALYDYNCREKFWNVLQRMIPHWSEMSDKQKAALCSFAYNNGAYFYGDGEHNTIDRHLRERNWSAVPGAMMLYRNPGDRTEVGLGRRRRAEGLIWLGMDPAQAISQAEREINTPADCEAWEQKLIQQQGAGPATPARPASEAERPAYDPTAPINWQDMNARVSRYFTVGEVTQKDRRRIPRAGSQEENNILLLAKELDKVRDAWGSPIGVTSWYRPNSPIDINAEVGGVSNSQHITGRAADVYTMDGRDQEFEHWLDTVGWKDRALGYGVAAGRGFTHVDLRQGKIRWPY